MFYNYEFEEQFCWYLKKIIGFNDRDNKKHIDTDNIICSLFTNLANILLRVSQTSSYIFSCKTVYLMQLICDDNVLT